MNLNERIRTVMQDAGLSQAKFAKEIEISPQAISLILKGTNQPSQQTVSLICSKFHIRREWLESGVEPMRYPADESAEESEMLNELMTDVENPVYDVVKAYMQTYLSLDENGRAAAKEFAGALLETIREQKK